MIDLKFIEIDTSITKVFDYDDYVEIDNKSVGKYITYVIGDIHGNALKLLHFLFYTGIALAKKDVQLNIQTAYKTRNYKLFKENLNKIFIHKLNIKKVRLILTGDTLCDRGNSDFMILLIYQFLAVNNVKFTICLSNHDSAFVYQMTNFVKNKRWDIVNMPLKPTDSFDLALLSKDDQNMCVNIYYHIYLPRLQLVAYDVCNNKELICSHAPCNYTMINEICPNAKRLTLKELVKTVNKELQDSITNNNFNYNWIRQKCFNFIWNRDTNSAKNKRNIINIFGHIGQFDINNDNQKNLDSNIGKDEQLDKGLLRIYKVTRDDLVYKIRTKLDFDETEMNKDLIKIINKVKQSSSIYYSNCLRSNRKGKAFEKILDICNNMKLNKSQIIRVVKILAIIASIPRGETKDVKKITGINHKTIKKTKSSEALISEISKTPKIQFLLIKNKTVLNSYENLIDFCGESIKSLYLEKDILYGRVNDLENELNELN